MHAVAQVFEDVALEQVAAGSVDVDAIAGFAHLVADDPGAVYGIQMDAVAAVLGAQAGVALDVVVDQADVPRAIDPDTEALALHPVPTNHGPLGDRLDEDGRVHGREVVAPVQEGTALDLDVRGANDQPIALALPLEYCIRRAREGHGLVDAERAPVVARRQAPLLGALGLQRQIGDRLRCAERPAR